MNKEPSEVADKERLEWAPPTLAKLPAQSAESSPLGPNPDIGLYS